MYNQPPTLPSITTVGNGIEYSSSNGDIARIKQEKDVVHHSLPPIRAMNNDNCNNNSIMSINQLCNDPDDEMKKAAAVLENMKQTALPPIEVTQLSSTHEGSIASPNSDGLIARLGELPFLRRTKTAYEQGKNTSPLIKYTTEMVESSVSTVIEKIPQLAQLDQYACRGLDKLGEMMENNNNNNNNNNNYNNNNSSNNDNDISVLHVAMVDGDDSSYGPCNEDISMGGDESRKRKVRGEPARDSYRNPPSRTHRTSQSNGSQNSTSYVPYAYHNNNNTVSTSTTSPAPFPSRWQQMLVGAGAAVGTARAVVNEESMKSLRYCLEWLQYATQSIEHQITVLRDLIVKLTTPSSDSALVHSNASTTLSTIKKNIVDNLRKVIDIVSRYASKCLPDQAKQNVRSFILSLPTRWATINHSDLSASLSPLSSPQLNPINAHPNHQTADYAHRLLSLATESLDMLLRVKGTFGESVERAEAWLERLKAIPPVGWSSQPATTNDYSYGQSSSTLHSPPSFRPRKSSNSSRVSNRKYNRTIPVDDDDESIINNYDSDDSDDSEVENKRMEDNRSNRSQNSSKSPSPHGGVNGRRRKKVAKKDDRMDLSEPF